MRPDGEERNSCSVKICASLWLLSIGLKNSLLIDGVIELGHGRAYAKREAGMNHAQRLWAENRSQKTGLRLRLHVCLFRGVEPLTSHTCKLTDSQAAALEKYLRSHDFQFWEVPYARFAAGKEKTQVVFYESGKLVVQGKGTQDFVEFVLEPDILQEVKLGYETLLNP